MCLCQASRTLSLNRTVFCYPQDTRRDKAVIMVLTVEAEYYPLYGFKKLSQAGQRLEP